jgi:CheY-like chemotaxis protein
LPYIIHIEDNDIDRLILKRSLKKLDKDLEIDAFDGVAEAEEYFASVGNEGNRRPDLIITDNNMPYKSGFELVKYIRSLESLAGIPIVMLSSSVLEHDIQNAYKLGVDSYLCKPINASAIEHIIDFLKAK